MGGGGGWWWRRVGVGVDWQSSVAAMWTGPAEFAEGERRRRFGFRPRLTCVNALMYVSQSGVAASLCHRTPQAPRSRLSFAPMSAKLVKCGELTLSPTPCQVWRVDPLAKHKCGELTLSPNSEEPFIA